MKTCIMNTKGGSSKSTTALQVAASRYLWLQEEIKLIELDDENTDSMTFSRTEIETQQVKVGNGANLHGVLQDILLSSDNKVIDVGGNKTTTYVLEALKSSRMYHQIDLFIIPMSGGYQDVKNAKKTYDIVKDFGKPIIFALSRVRNPDRIKFQYRQFYNTFDESQVDYFVLPDDDVIDLSRYLKKTIYELYDDKEMQEKYENAIVQYSDNNDYENIRLTSDILSILHDSTRYTEEYLIPAFKKISKYDTKAVYHEK